MNKFHALFPTGRPVLGMLHLGGGPRDMLSLALQEAQLLNDAGVDGIIVENYFGTIDNVQMVLAALADIGLQCKIGINLLGETDLAFAMADQFRVDFVQIDSVCGHLKPDDDAAYADWLATMRAHSNAAVLGGVRFKYMPVLSGRSEKTDLLLGRERCDAIVVTSDATGQETDMDKVRRFRAILGTEHPLLIGAGLTPANVAQQFSVANGGIVGSWLKEGHVDSGQMNATYVHTFLEAARRATS